MIRIEKNIRFPSKRKYPFPDMEIGDSIFIKKQTNQGGAVSAVHKYAKDNDKVFTTRSEPDGVRIWRVK